MRSMTMIGRGVHALCFHETRLRSQAPSLLTLGHHLHRAHNATKRDDHSHSDDPEPWLVAQGFKAEAGTLEDALQWEIRQIERSFGDSGDSKPSRAARSQDLLLHLP